MKLLKYANQKFAHHHLHTEYSPMDAPVSLKKLVEYSKHLGYKTITVTDHGTVGSWVKLASACKDAGIKPIFGIEGYFVDDRHIKKGGRDHNHIVLLAKTNEGIRNIYKMSEISWKEGYYYGDPRMDWELLEKYHEGVICTTSCVSGVVPDLVRNDKYEEALTNAKRFQSIFGKDFYAEVQYHCLDVEKKAYAGVAKIAASLGLPLLGTNDVHYLRKEDSSTQEAMMAVNTGRCPEGPKRMRHEQNQLYLKSPDEMIEMFGGKDRLAIRSSLEIADVCTAELQFGKTQLPSIEIPKEFKSDTEYLEYLARKGMKDRGKEGIPEYEARYEEEMGVIRKLREKGLRFDRYFLIVWDFVNWAWENGIRVGAGRGSGAGSLILYCLKITGIDPIRFDLLFERFLTMDRNEMPDIDIDFDNERGPEVSRYCCQKYGGERFAKICSVSQLHVASAIKAAFKAFDPGGTWEEQQSSDDVTKTQQKNQGTKVRRTEKKGRDRNENDTLANDVTKLLPRGPSGGPSDKCTLIKSIADADDEMIYVYDDPKFQDLKRQYPEVFDFAEKIEGLNGPKSIHASGVVITEDPLVEVCPQQLSGKGKNKEPATVYDMEDLEKLGLIKFDQLKQKALTVITRVLGWVKERHGLTLDVDETIDLEDKKVLDMFARGETTAIFQFESPGMVSTLRDMKVTCFDNLIAANALYRPGPMDFIEDYCQRKNGRQQVRYAAPALESLLKPTYGIMVYQEQVMSITKILAGFSGSEADKVRKAMGKKKPEVLAAMKDKFIKGCDKVGNCDSQTASMIWDQMEEFSKYAFNKSHSAAYSFIAYQCAWLKTYYPGEFMAAQLSVEGADSKYDIVTKYENAAAEMGFKILPPNVSTAKGDYMVETNAGRSCIRKGFKGVKGLGEQVYMDIIKGQPYTDMFDYCMRAEAGTKSDVVKTLIDDGGFNWLKPILEQRPVFHGKKATTADFELEYNIQIERAKREKKDKTRNEEVKGMGTPFGFKMKKKGYELNV